MATYTNGLFGPFKGSVDNVVGSNYRGKPIMRIKGQTSTKPPSQAQLLQRFKFSVMMPFLNPLKPLLLQTFKNHPTDRAGFDAAKSYVMTEVYYSLLVTLWLSITLKCLLVEAICEGLIRQVSA